VATLVTFVNCELSKLEMWCCAYLAVISILVFIS